MKESSFTKTEKILVEEGWTCETL